MLAIRHQKSLGNTILRRFIPHPRNHTRFYLHTRKNYDIPQELKVGDLNSFLSSNFDPENPVRILIHGYLGHPKTHFINVTKEAYLSRGDFNVIILDWSDIGTLPGYLIVMDLLSDQAKVLNDFTKFMNKYLNVSYDNIYLIGFSMGAHLAGYAGRLLSPYKYNTIFLLEPTAVGYQTRVRYNRSLIARSGDAKYVEAIHTDTKVFGYYGRHGDADFYPDYSRVQKNCIFERYHFNFGCEHCAVTNYFASTINEPEDWIAQPCDSYRQLIDKRICKCVKSKLKYCKQKAYMGGEPSVPKRGVFYVDVKLRDP